MAYFPWWSKDSYLPSLGPCAGVVVHETSVAVYEDYLGFGESLTRSLVMALPVLPVLEVLHMEKKQFMAGT